MDGKLDTRSDARVATQNDIASRGEYLERMQGMVDGIQDGERREAAQSALNEVGRDLGFSIATDSPQQDAGVERERDFEREA